MPDVTDLNAGGSRRPVAAVLFDFHGTIAQVEDAEKCVRLAAATCGHELDLEETADLAVRVAAAGRAGGWPPAVIPPHLVDVWERRDLSAGAHRAAYVGIADTVDSGIDGLSEAMYERLLTPEGWLPYPDTVPVLQALRDESVRVAVLSNIGFDIRSIGKAYGFADLVDSWVLSYEVGICKPDPEIFRYACAELGVEPAQTLMVGDTVADAGAVVVGCSALVLPASPPGRTHGLGAILGLV